MLPLRIKLPPKPNEADVVEPLPGRRKKRRLTVNSDEEDDYTDSGHPGDIASPTQVNSDPESEEYTAENDSRFLHDSYSHQTHTPDPQPKKAKRKRTPDPAFSTKRKRGVSEQDTDDEYIVDNDIATSGMDVDADFEAEHKRHPKKAKAKASGKPMKGKGLVDVSDITGKEGRISPAKTNAESTEPRSNAGSKRPRVRPVRLEDAADAASSPDLSVTRSPSPPRETTPPPIAKKRKLPTIRKNRTAGAPGTSTPSTVVPPNKAAPVAGLPKQSLLEGAKPAAVRKTPATAGNADFDLRNESVYRELFKPVSLRVGQHYHAFIYQCQTGGSTPRSGLSRREKDEERRKELNKLRDEAKAKRLLDTVR